MILRLFYVFVCALAFGSSVDAGIVNGDFQTGALTGWLIQEDYATVAGSPLVTTNPINGSEYVGTLMTGYSDHGVYVSSLLQADLTISTFALELVFDFRITDMGPDSGGEGLFIDQLSVSLLTDGGNVDPLLAVDAQGYTAASEVVSVTDLGNGFFHVVTDILALAGSSASSVIFDLYDEDDGRLTRADIDNVFIVIPEPVAILLLGCGTVFLRSTRRRIKSGLK